jgi:hypothetical protein
MIRILHQLSDCASVSVCIRAAVGQNFSPLSEQCGPILLRVYGEVMLAKHRRSIRLLIKKAYRLYFGCKLSDQDTKWAPHIV